ncbi:hypothetical protein CYJ10_30815 [Cupriavidus pauculus]|uniref:Uncharacterized protein n=1 Tax=Cupriavidus pauculus TaxID=82633 RepID=A0A2N5C3J1_9BURK|nr:hypothetical protein CYJ10_30815 [Cupriavidus pauculus]
MAKLNLNGRMPVGDYIWSMGRTIDGLAWIGTSIASLVLAIGLLLGVSLAPLRYTDDASAITALLLYPVLSFVLVVRARYVSQSAWFGVLICCALFFGLHFYKGRIPTLYDAVRVVKCAFRSCPTP